MSIWNVVYVGIQGSVVALDAVTGEQLWRRALKGQDFVNLCLRDGFVYATTRGEAFCLDAATGHVRWNNKLKGLGWGLAGLAVPGAESTGLTVSAAEKRRRDQHSAADAS